MVLPVGARHHPDMPVATGGSTVPGGSPARLGHGDGHMTHHVHAMSEAAVIWIAPIRGPGDAPGPPGLSA
jgi:hypothetical protein